MLKLVFAFAFLLVLSPSSLLGVDAATCPDAQILTPCTCGNYNTNLLYLNCASKSLTDGRIELILSFFQSNDTQLGRLDLYNNPLLTHVPPAIKTFTQLGNTVQLQLNGFTSIESGAFQFQDSANPVKDLYLNSNKLTTISPNAFNGLILKTMFYYIRALFNLHFIIRLFRNKGVHYEYHNQSLFQPIKPFRVNCLSVFAREIRSVWRPSFCLRQYFVKYKILILLALIKKWDNLFHCFIFFLTKNVYRPVQL